MLIKCRGNKDDYIEFSDEIIHPDLLQITVNEKNSESNILINKKDIKKLIMHLKEILGEENDM